MKQLKLKALALTNVEMLSRTQMKSVLGGNIDCPCKNECNTNDDCPGASDCEGPQVTCMTDTGCTYKTCSGRE